jgi:hypothetical protein
MGWAFLERGGDVLKKTAALLTVLCVAVPALARAGDEGKEKKGKRPALELRSTPRFAFSPANVMLTAELKGGDDVEELYCPEVEWEFGDGDKSTQEADCDPWTPTTRLERRFTVRHIYKFAGAYLVRVTLRKSGRDLMTQTYAMTIRAGLGDPNEDPG